jgi:hypothetical protein
MKFKELTKQTDYAVAYSEEGTPLVSVGDYDAGRLETPGEDHVRGRLYRMSTTPKLIAKAEELVGDYQPRQLLEPA